MSLLKSAKEVIEFHLNNGITIIEVLYELGKPIVKYYQVPREQLKQQVLDGRSEETLRLQKLMDQAMEMDPEKAKEQIKQHTKEGIKQTVLRETGADQIIQSAQDIKDTVTSLKSPLTGGYKYLKSKTKTKTKSKSKTRSNSKTKTKTKTTISMRKYKRWHKSLTKKGGKSHKNKKTRKQH